jgi:hypothetical protein
LALCKAAKPPPGFEPTPRSKVGSYRKKTAAGYVYWQPGEEVSEAKAGEEQVTAEQAGKTAGRYAKLETKMRKQVGRALRVGGGERAMRLMEDYLEVSKRAAAWKAKHAELGGGEQPIPGKKPGLRPAEGRPAGKPEEKPQKRAPTKAERRKKAAEMRKRREEAEVRGPEEAAREKREAEEAEARQRKAKREGKKYAESEAGKKAAARVRRKAKRKKAEPEPGLPERYFKRVGQKREQAPTVEAKPAKGKRFRKGISLRKAKRFPVGTIREWKGKKYIKTTEGWVQYRAAVHAKPAKETAK